MPYVMQPPSHLRFRAFSARNGAPSLPATGTTLTTVSSPAMSPDGKLGRLHRDDRHARAENKRHTESVGRADGRRRAAAIHVAEHRELQSALVAGREVPALHVAATGRQGSTWGLRMDQPGGEAFEVDEVSRPARRRRQAFVVWSDGAPTRAAPTPRRSDPLRQMQPMARPPFGAITEAARSHALRRTSRHDMRYKTNDQGFVPGPARGPRVSPAQIWMQPFDGSSEAQLITSTRYSHRSAAVSPDGQWIAFVADRALRPDSVVEAERDSLARLPYDAKRDEAPRNDVDIYRHAVAGGAPRQRRDDLRRRGRSRLVARQQANLAFIAAPTRTSNAPASTS